MVKSRGCKEFRVRDQKPEKKFQLKNTYSRSVTYL